MRFRMCTAELVGVSGPAKVKTWTVLSGSSLIICLVRSWQAAILLTVLALGACALEVKRRPALLTAVAPQPTETIEVLDDVSISVGVGYQRVIPRGSAWTRVGRVAEGDVYKPLDRVFTVEGAHVHEAYLVLADDRVVGFYLPVEQAFSPAPDGPNTRLAFKRRQP